MACSLTVFAFSKIQYDVGKTPAGSSTPIAVFAEGDVTSVGFASPKLYRGSALLTSNTPLGFPDVIVGANGLYAATPGWDYTTGLGTPDVSLLNALIH